MRALIEARHFNKESYAKLHPAGAIGRALVLRVSDIMRTGERLARLPLSATIMDAIDHLEHAIRIMGIDHVGIGTDFDGDGTVRGCADASELIHFTMHLLAKKYSERDIAKIWGGNWLRVMAQVQAVRG